MDYIIFLMCSYVCMFNVSIVLYEYVYVCTLYATILSCCVSDIKE